MKRFVVLIAGVVACAATSVGPSRDGRFRGAPTLLRPATLRTVAKSSASLLVSLYWLRVVNLIAQPESQEKNRSLADYGRLLTEVDPRFYYVYFYLGLCIPYRSGLMQYANAKEAAALLEAGLRHFPDDVRLRTIYGYTLFEMLGDARAAAVQFDILSKVPGAPSYARRLSARLLAQSEGGDTALAILDELVLSCGDDESWECDRVRRERRELGIELHLQSIERAAAAFLEARGRHAGDVNELIREGFFAGFATDPEGNPISLSEGRASSPGLKRRFEVYR